MTDDNCKNTRLPEFSMTSPVLGKKWDEDEALSGHYVPIIWEAKMLCGILFYFRMQQVIRQANIKLLW